MLPGLVAALTPVPYRALLARTPRRARDRVHDDEPVRRAAAAHRADARRSCANTSASTASGEPLTDVIVPASFNFPHTGKLLSLSFVLFAGWFADAPVPVQRLSAAGGDRLLVMFGNVNAAIPFLLDLLRIPADTFRLFVTTGVVNARFGTLVAAVHTLAVALLGTCAVAGALRSTPASCSLRGGHGAADVRRGGRHAAAAQPALSADTTRTRF